MTSQSRGNVVASSSSFIPRPFPPPSLQNVPEAYIVSQLHRLAPNYWSKPETADCTLIVPCDTGQQARQQTRSESSAHRTSPDPLTTGPFSAQTWTSRRESESHSVNARRLILKLHQDYLSAQSTFMRTLLSGSSPLDISTAVTPSASELEPKTSVSSLLPLRQPSSHLAAGAFPIHSSRHPRILPSSSSHHPVIFLPVPDSSSFPHLVHYCYFGTFDYMEDCLHRGVITWQGVVRNVEYLGMRVELKALLGRYYRQWLRPNTRMQAELRTASVMEESDDEDIGSNRSYGSQTSYGSGRSRDPPDSPMPQPAD